MSTEENTQTEPKPFSSYLPSIVIVGIIFGVISTVIGLFFGYQQINAEPSGSMFSPLMMSGVVVCLVTFFAGAVAIWHYTKEVSPTLTLGQGALIGFLTGTVIVIFSIVINEIWALIDPDYIEKVIESSIANLEAMDIPDSAKEDAIDSMVEGIQTSQSISRQLFWGIPITGLLNLISGLIGVKLFAKKEAEETF